MGCFPSRDASVPQHPQDNDIPLRRVPVPAIIEHEAMPFQTLNAAVSAAGAALAAETDYALIGGAALRYHGSQRATTDLDILARDASTVQNALLQTRAFRRGELGNLYFRAPDGRNYNVDVVTHIRTGLENFPPANQITERGLIRMGTLKLILHMKCISFMDRNRQSKGKQETDAADIVFIILKLRSDGISIDPTEVPSANSQFFAVFLQKYPSTEQAWRDIGMLSAV